MGSRYMSVITAILLVVAIASLVLCLDLYGRLNAQQEHLRQAYGGRAFSLRAVSALTGSPHRFDRQDIEFIRDGLSDEGIVVVGLGSSYIDYHKVDDTVLGPSAGYGYLLFETRGDTSLIDGMKSVSGFLLAYYPELQIDVYSEYERFVAQSAEIRSVLRLAIAAALIGCAITGVLIWADLSQRVNAGCEEILVRLVAGSPHVRVAGLLVRREIKRGLLAGIGGCLLYLAVCASGVLPAAFIAKPGCAVGPAILGLLIAMLTILAAVIGPARRVCAIDSLIYSDNRLSERL